MFLDDKFDFVLTADPFHPVDALPLGVLGTANNLLHFIERTVRLENRSWKVKDNGSIIPVKCSTIKHAVHKKSQRFKPRPPVLGRQLFPTPWLTSFLDGPLPGRSAVGWTFLGAAITFLASFTVPLQVSFIHTAVSLQTRISSCVCACFAVNFTSRYSAARTSSSCSFVLKRILMNQRKKEILQR